MSQPTGRPARYERTTGGLVGSMIVTVVVVLAAVLFLRADNGAAEQGPTAVDYLETVDAAQGAGIAVVHPPRLPEGWIATSVVLDPGTPPDWGIGFLTDDGRFAGVRQADEDLDDLLATYVDAETTQGPDLSADSPLATTWTSWSDSGGDHAYAADVDLGQGEQRVLVYGSADVADLQGLLESLVVS